MAEPAVPSKFVKKLIGIAQDQFDRFSNRDEEE